MINNIKKYDIWLIDLEPVVWSEQAWVRPCLVAQNNLFFSNQNTSIVLPITWKIKKSWKFRVRIKDYEKVGLDMISTILSFQIRTVDKTRFIKKIWEITENKIKEKIKQSLLISLDIDDEFEE